MNSYLCTNQPTGYKWVNENVSVKSQVLGNGFHRALWRIHFSRSTCIYRMHLNVSVCQSCIEVLSTQSMIFAVAIWMWSWTFLWVVNLAANWQLMYLCLGKCWAPVFFSHTFLIHAVGTMIIGCGCVRLSVFTSFDVITINIVDGFRCKILDLLIVGLDVGGFWYKSNKPYNVALRLNIQGQIKVMWIKTFRLVSNISAVVCYSLLFTF